MISRYGSLEQQAALAPGPRRRQTKMAFAITEPDAGSNTPSDQHHRDRDGDGWRLSGTKYYISCVDEAEAMVVVARTGVNELTGRGELSLFIVDCETRASHARSSRSRS